MVDPPFLKLVTPGDETASSMSTENARTSGILKPRDRRFATHRYHQDHRYISLLKRISSLYYDGNTNLAYTLYIIFQNIGPINQNKWLGAKLIDRLSVQTEFGLK